MAALAQDMFSNFCATKLQKRGTTESLEYSKHRYGIEQRTLDTNAEKQLS